MDIETLEEDLTNYLRRLDDTPEPVANAFRNAYVKHGISGNDVRVIVGHGDRKSEIARLRTELRDLQTKLDGVQQARGLTWQEFVTACGDKIDTRKRGWRNMIAPHLNCSVADFLVWEQMGRAPYDLLNQLAAMPDLRGDNPTTRSASLASTVGSLVTALRHGRTADKKIVTLLGQLVATANAETLQAALTKALAETEVPVKPTKVKPTKGHNPELESLRRRIATLEAAGYQSNADIEPDSDGNVPYSAFLIALLAARDWRMQDAHKDFARLADVGQQQLSHWCERGKVPHRYFQQIGQLSFSKVRQPDMKWTEGAVGKLRELFSSELVPSDAEIAKELRRDGYPVSDHAVHNKARSLGLLKTAKRKRRLNKYGDNG